MLTKLQKEQLAQEIIGKLKGMFDEDIRFECTPMHWSNEETIGISMTLPGSMSSPMVYIEDMDEDSTLDEKVNFAAVRFQEILRGRAEGKYDAIPDVPKLSREYILDNVVLQALSQVRNRGLMESKPHFRMLDLIGVFRIPVGPIVRNNLNSFLLPYEVLVAYDLSIDELRAAASRNTVRKLGLELLSMEDSRRMLVEGDRWKPSAPFSKVKMNKPRSYTLTNSIHINGAAAILIPKVLADVGKKARMNYFILPSSIHEVMIFRDNGMTSGGNLKQMLYRGNRSSSTVKPKDVLSDSVYYYSISDRRLTII